MNEDLQVYYNEVRFRRRIIDFILKTAIEEQNENELDVVRVVPTPTDSIEQGKRKISEYYEWVIGKKGSNGDQESREYNGDIGEVIAWCKYISGRLGFEIAAIEEKLGL